MSNTNTGGPAFPQCSYNMKGGYDITSGMTLRDYIAIEAMKVIYSANCEWEPTGMPADEETLKLFDEVATDAYLMANAVLKAREA